MPDINATYDINIAKVQEAFATVETMGKRAAAAVNTAGAGGAFRAQRQGAQKAAQTFAVVKKEADAAGAAANRAGGAVTGFGAKVRRAGTAAAAISAIIVALVALNRRFPVIGQVAAKSFEVIKTTAQAAMVTTGKFAFALSNLKAAAGAAVGIYTLAKAFRTLRGSAAGTENIKVPKLPTGGGGMGLGAKAGIAGLALGGLGLAAMAFDQVKDGITRAVSSAANAEQTQISFEVLTGGFDNAKQLLGEIRQLAKDTPLSFGDLSGAGRQLAAFKEPLDQLPDTLRRIGDISSGIQAPIGEIAEIYGKARVQGTLFAEDINQLTGRGIDVISEFASQLGVGTDQVKKLGSEGKITFPMLEAAFAAMTDEGGSFAGMMERQSKTLAGLWSTLKDNVAMAFTAMGSPINDALKPILEKAIEMAEALPDLFSNVGSKVAEVINFIHAAFKTLSGGEILGAIGDALQLAFLKAIDLLARGMQAALALFRDTSFMDGLGNKLQSAALLFKEIMLSAAAEILAALSLAAESLPGGKGNRLATGFDNAAGLASATADVASAQREALGAEPGTQKDLAQAIKKEFDAAGGVFGEQIARVESRLGKNLEPVWAEAARLLAEQTATGEDGGNGGRAPGETIAGAGTAMAAAGAFQQAKNLIAGKTVNELVAQEAAKTNSQLGKIASGQDRLTTAVGKVERAIRDKKTEVEVELVPKFS